MAGGCVLSFATVFINSYKNLTTIMAVQVYRDFVYNTKHTILKINTLSWQKINLIKIKINSSIHKSNFTVNEINLLPYVIIVLIKTSDFSIKIATKIWLPLKLKEINETQITVIAFRTMKDQKQLYFKVFDWHIV